MNLRQELLFRRSKPGGDRLQCGNTRGSLHRQRHKCRPRRCLRLSLLAYPSMHHVRVQAATPPTLAPGWTQRGSTSALNCSLYSRRRGRSLTLPLYSRPRPSRNKAPGPSLVPGARAACCRLNSRGERIFSDECGCRSLKCSKAAGSCPSTVCASRRSMRAT